MKARGGKVVADALAAEGVRFTFGIPGTHNIELYDALEDTPSITPVLVTDEQSAGFMADGVARTTGTVAVVNVVPGAGVTHALSGIAEAFMDTVPLVVLTCGIRTDTGKSFQLHDIDQLAVLRPITKGTFAVRDAAEIVPSIRAAFRLARSGSPGPVAVEIPANLYLLAHEIAADQGGAAARESQPAAPARAEVARVAERLRSARRAVLYAGMGARAASRELVRLAETLALPVASTISGKGVFPEDHPLFLWNGMGRSAPPFVREVTDEADVMLAIGCRFGEVATASYGFEPPPGLIHVDINPDVFNRNAAAEIAVAADAGDFLRALLEVVEPRGRDVALEETIAAGHRAVSATQHTPGPADRVSPAALFDAVAALAPDAIVSTDSGNGTFLAMEHLRITAPGRFLAPVDYSCMGYAVPAAIGAKLANPDADVIAFPGDGALLMTGLELLTAASHHAGVVVVVLRDGELSQIAQFQRTTLNRDTCSILAPYQVEDLARAAGCRYAKATGDGDVRAALEEALVLARGGIPVMVEVPIDSQRKTYFTKGVVTTNFWRLPWGDRLRIATRALGRKLSR